MDIKIISIVSYVGRFRFVSHRSTKKTGSFDYKIEVRANDTEQIVKAVENLEISDIYIRTRETSWFEGNPNMIKYTIGSYATMGFFLGAYYAILCLVNALLFRPKKDASLLNQP